jgi:D-serine deaminase-like pyridoxal phosphate-dependent protein
MLSAMAMESLGELIFVIAAVIMALSPLPRGTAGRFVLGLAGVVLAAVGVTLFVVIAYPRETLLILGAGSMTPGRDGGMPTSPTGSCGWTREFSPRWAA